MVCSENEKDDGIRKYAFMERNPLNGAPITFLKNTNFPLFEVFLKSQQLLFIPVDRTASGFASPT